MIELLIPFFIGIIFIIISLKLQSKYNQLLKIGERTEGIVFDTEKSKNSDSNTQYPIIRFTTRTGEWITKKFEFGISVSTYKPGDKVKVIYDPNKPEDFMLESKMQKIIAQLLLLLGIVALLIGAFLIIRN